MTLVTTGAEKQGLRLKARDAEDFRVLSAVLQDALAPLGDMSWQKDERRFVLVINRFMWELAEGAAMASDPARSEPEEGDAAFESEGPLPRFQRVNCGLVFDKVAGVQFQGVDPRRRDQILNLLAVASQPEFVTLIFSEDVAIRLRGRGLVCHLEDLGEPWPTDWRPAHALDDPEAEG